MTTVKNHIVTLDNYRPHPANYNRHSDAQLAKLQASLSKFGQVRSIVVWREYIIAGHGLTEAAKRLGWKSLRADVLDSAISESVALAYLVADNELARQSDPDQAALAAILDQVKQADAELLTAAGFSEQELSELLASLEPASEPVDAPAQVDRAEELQAVWNVQAGDVWQIGEHRLVCGDCTDKATVERLMGGNKAALCHADPPYGMGKEKDGIANDNLYREKLDAFQMLWWQACRPSLEDNASAYIWGNAEDLWRLWYAGGLKSSERLTLRNEIVWVKTYGTGDQPDAMGQGADFRSYAPATERCLFFMLGEQGFNNNADNYWEGWDSIVDYLDKSRQAMGWGIKDTKRIAGHSEISGCHWFDKSQWSMPTEQVYRAWQAAARGDAFKRDYDDLKRDFYSTRAYFDNAHDNMTDVWQFARVQGDDRHEHATPKPVDMVARAIKSSTPEGGIVYVPFAGTGPELIACHNLHRIARCVEISPLYCSVILQRMFDATGITGVRVEA